MKSLLICLVLRSFVSPMHYFCSRPGPGISSADDWLEIKGFPINKYSFKEHNYYYNVLMRGRNIAGGEIRIFDDIITKGSGEGARMLIERRIDALDEAVSAFIGEYVKSCYIEEDRWHFLFAGTELTRPVTLKDFNGGLLSRLVFYESLTDYLVKLLTKGVFFVSFELEDVFLVHGRLRKPIVAALNTCCSIETMWDDFTYYAAHERMGPRPYPSYASYTALIKRDRDSVTLRTYAEDFLAVNVFRMIIDLEEKLADPSSGYRRDGRYGAFLKFAYVRNYLPFKFPKSTEVIKRIIELKAVLINKGLEWEKPIFQPNNVKKIEKLPEQPSKIVATDIKPHPIISTQEKVLENLQSNHEKVESPIKSSQKFQKTEREKHLVSPVPISVPTIKSKRLKNSLGSLLSCIGMKSSGSKQKKHSSKCQR